MDERTLLEALAVDDPWCHSREGLDDGCHFCEGWEDLWQNEPTIYLHDQDCVWIAAMDYLGRSHPQHVAKPTVLAATAVETPGP